MQAINYEDFIQSKRKSAPAVGFDVKTISKQLFPFQRDIVRWSLRKGRSAIFADCGLGKTPIELEWAKHVSAHTQKPVLILAPLAVASQIAREGEKFSVPVTICERPEDVQPGVNVTNYEKLHRFSEAAHLFGGIVLDESSILKAFEGKTRKLITDFARKIYFRLAATATPAPNDLIELTNHAEFLDVMTGKEIIALFFTQDGNTTHKWRLKGHAKRDFWRWLSTWTIALRKPSDLGYEDDQFVLPPLTINEVVVESKPLEGYLFPVEAKTLNERRQAKRDSLQLRAQQCADLVNGNEEPWLLWVNLNDEADALTALIPDAVEIRGNDSEEYKARTMEMFSRGEIRVLVSKPSICGFGMNWQHCARMAFVGLSDSFEQLYQATRRCWRFGQKREVIVYHIVSEAEGSIVTNIKRKEAQAAEMMAELVNEMKESMIKELKPKQTKREKFDYKEQIHEAEEFTLYLGDSVKTIKQIADDSIGLSVFSPPFPGMYAYTNSPQDIGNCGTIDQMIEHFKFLIPELLRVVMPGRMCCIHLCQLTSMKSREGYIGLHDYRGRVISAMIEGGWVYAGDVTIDKNPQIQATRNKERGLLFQSLAKDASVMRMALADYLICFRKPGDNPIPIRAGISERYNNPNGWITEQEWIEWAAPVWYRHVSPTGKNAEAQPNYPSLRMQATHLRQKQDGLVSYNGVMETDVLNVVQARETDDERHLCPLQLSVIERAVKLWSAPGDIVYSPFAGVGSEGYQSLKLWRRFVGSELKESYFKSAITNCNRGIKDRERLSSTSLLDLIEEDAAA